MLTAVSACTDTPDEPPEDPRIEQAKAAVSKDMKDPAAVQFRNMSATDHCVTGSQNSKNGFGAYVGFKEFAYSLKSKSVFMAGDLLTPLTEPALAEMKSNVDLMTVRQKCIAGDF